MKALLRQALIDTPKITLGPDVSPRLADAIEAIAYAKSLLGDGLISLSEFELAVDTALEWLP